MSTRHSLPPSPGRGPSPLPPLVNGQAPSPRSSPSKARRLSRRKVRQLIGIGQSWVCVHDGTVWKAAGVWRVDGRVSLVAPRPGGAERRRATFRELANSYRLVEGLDG
jgi:hypothetical protein